MLKSIFCSAASAMVALAGWSATATPVAAAQAPIEVTTALGHRLLREGERQTVYLRIALKGLRPERADERPPMNIALVIDRSGSMSGQRIAAAREAAMMAVDRLSPRDIISVVSYDDRIQVEVPAMRARDLSQIKEQIRSLTPRGSTAIWAGMQAGADEVRKHFSRERVNKIILLSDGLANVGPRHPEAFAELGARLGGEGIIVSTIGLGNGYNEDLMAALALNADGTHKFVSEPQDLAEFFAHEFDDAAGVIAQDIDIFIDCLPGVVPMKSLGRQADISGNRIRYKLNQVIGGTEQALIVALDVPANVARDVRDLAKVKVSYRPRDSKEERTARFDVKGRFSGDTAAVKSSIDPAVMRDVTVLTARDMKNEAMKMRDAGKREEAQRKFQDTVKYLRQQQQVVPGADKFAPLEQELKANEAASAPTAQSASGWSKARKALRESDTNQAGTKYRY